MKTEATQPIEELMDFIACYGLEHVQQKLDQMFDSALSSEEADHWSQNERCSILFFYRQTKKLLIAVYAMSDVFENLQELNKSKSNE